VSYVAEAECVRQLFTGVRALDDVSIWVQKGLHLLVGPNGSGKTTLLRVLTGALRPTRGFVRVLGMDPFKETRMLMKRVGVAYDKHSLPRWAKGINFMRFAAQAKGLGDLKDILGIIKAFGVDSYWEREISTYSAGMYQKLVLSQAFLGDPELVILDEPTSDLDRHAKDVFRQLVKDGLERGTTFILATHLIEEYGSPTHMTVMNRGRVLASGDVAELAEMHGAASLVIGVEDPLAAARVLRDRAPFPITLMGDRIEVKAGRGDLDRILRILEEAKVDHEYKGLSIDYRAIYANLLAIS